MTDRYPRSIVDNLDRLTFRHSIGLTMAHLLRWHLRVPVLLLLLQAVPSLAQTGALDPGFSAGTGANGLIRRVVPLASGGMIVSGSFTTMNGQPCGRIARLLDDGTYDPTFTTGTGFNGQVNDMDLQSDGRIIAIGTFTQFNDTPVDRIARLLPDGTLDVSFAPVITTALTSVRVLPDDRFTLTGGFTVTGVSNLLRCARFHADGTLDQALSTLSNTNNTVINSCTMADGRTVITGSFTVVQGLSRRGIAVIGTNGTIDSSFDPGTGFNMESASLQRVQMGASGRIYAMGIFQNYNGTPVSNVVRLETDGSLSPGWNTTVNYDNGVQSILERPDGSVVCTGLFTNVGGNARGRFCILDPSGDPVPGPPYGAGANSNVSTSVLDGTGKLLICGTFTSFNGAAHGCIARLFQCGTDHWYADLDGDGYGDPAAEEITCNPPANYVANDDDCDDTDAGETTGTTWYADADGDGAGDPVASAVACTAPSGYVANANDCDDNDPLASGPTVWYIDEDGDGSGNAMAPTLIACTAPNGYVSNANDCDDNDDNIGAPMLWYFDGDNDEFGDPLNTVLACSPPPGYVESGSDCDDDDPTIYFTAVCEDNNPYTYNDQFSDYPMCQCTGQTLQLSAKAFLQGAYDPATGLMRDDLRQLGLIPLTEPYTALGYDFGNSQVAGGETTTQAVLDTEGPDAIVDWVILELRHSSFVDLHRTTRCALVQRDGDIVETDGVSPVRLPMAIGPYNVAVLHRNHRGAVSQIVNGMNINIDSIDFTDPTLPVYGTATRVVIDGMAMLRQGDVTFNDDIKYVGSGNDRDPILSRIGGAIPTATTTGYHQEDVNMDGVVKYVGFNNDRDPILQSIGGSNPTNVLPHNFLR